MLTFQDILAAREVLANLLSMTLPFKVSYRLAKLQRKVESTLKFIETERVKLVKQYGKETTSGNYTVEGEEALQQFALKYGELLQQPVEDFTLVTLDEKLVEDIKLAPKDWCLLDGIVEIIPNSTQVIPITQSEQVR